MTSKDRMLGPAPEDAKNPQENYITDINKALEVAYAEKSFRDQAREAGVSPEEKKQLDAIAEQHGEEKLRELEAMDKGGQDLIVRLGREEQSLVQLRDQLREIRESLELPASDEDVPSLLIAMGRITDLRQEQATYLGTRAQFIEKFKERMFEELEVQAMEMRIQRSHETFSHLSGGDVERVMTTGRTIEGKLITISEGSGRERVLRPGTAMVLAETYKKDLRTIPAILSEIPDFYSRLDDGFKQSVSDEAQELFAKKVETPAQAIDTKRKVVRERASERIGDQIEAVEEAIEEKEEASTGEENQKVISAGEAGQVADKTGKLLGEGEASGPVEVIEEPLDPGEGEIIPPPGKSNTNTQRFKRAA